MPLRRLCLRHNQCLSRTRIHPRIDPMTWLLWRKWKYPLQPLWSRFRSPMTVGMAFHRAQWLRRCLPWSRAPTAFGRGFHLGVGTPCPLRGLPAHGERQKVESFPAVHQTGLGLVEFQPSLFQPVLPPGFQGRALPRPARDDEVIRRANHDGLARDAFVDRPIQCLEVAISQQGRNHPALRGPAGVGFHPPSSFLRLFLDRRAQPPVGQPQQNGFQAR